MKWHITRWILVTVIGAWGLSLAAQDAPAPDRPATAPVDEEPPMRFTLQIEGKSVPVELDRPFQIAIGGRQMQGHLSAAATRLFQAAGVSFEYPRHFAFEVERDDPNVTLWTLDGNSGVIMIMRFSVPVGQEVLLGQFASQYGEGNVQRFATQISLGGQEFKGTRLLVSLAGTRLSQDVFLLPVPEGTLTMIVQDSLDDRGNPTDEVREVVRLLETTFRFISR